MTQPSFEALTGPAASIFRRRWFWVALVAVFALLGAVAGGSALAARGDLVTTAGTEEAAPEAALIVDGAVASSRSTPDVASAATGPGSVEATGAGSANGNGAPVVTPPANPAPAATDPSTTEQPATSGRVDGAIEVPPVVAPPSEGPAVAPVLTLPDRVPPVLPPPLPDAVPPVVAETPAGEEPGEVPEVPEDVVPQPAPVPVVAIGIAPGCLDDRAVLVQQAANQDTKGVSVNFLANADFATSGSLALTTAPNAEDRDQVTVTAGSGKPYVDAGAISVRTYRAGQTVDGVSHPAVSETRSLSYEAFTCEKPAINTNVKAMVVNGRIVLAMYAQNTGNTTVQVKFNPTAHFAGSASFPLAPGEAKYLTVATESTTVPAGPVAVNVVSSIQGKRVPLNQVDRHDAVSVVAPD